MNRKLEDIFKNAKNVDLILLLNTGNEDPNFLYLTEFESGLFENNILLTKRDRMELLTNSLEYETALKQKNKIMDVVNIKDSNEMSNMLKKEIEGKTIGLNMDFLPSRSLGIIKKFKPRRIVNISEAFAKARVIKDEVELKKMRIANSITKKAFKEIPKYFKEGITEKKIAARFNYLMAYNGSDKEAFDTIVSFGKNSALPHHFPDNTKLANNSIVLIDAGAKYKNYCADLTRTFFFKPDKTSTKYKKMSEIYETVYKAQQIGLEKAVEDEDGKDVHAAAAEFINTAHGGKYKGRFIHSLGHSIGIETHDPGASFSQQNVKLKKNMVISDEPGIYIVGFGGVRIEDDVLIGKKKSVFL
jgi:Xaa-Pro dipeptidase